jgi:hypothetical protein
MASSISADIPTIVLVFLLGVATSVASTSWAHQCGYIGAHGERGYAWTLAVPATTGDTDWPSHITGHLPPDPADAEGDRFVLRDDDTDKLILTLQAR